MDVLDLKTPQPRIVVGPKDRKRFSADVQSGLAQLREYASYFERGEYRDRVRETYGVTGYQPKTILVIGKRPDGVSEVEYRRIRADLPRSADVITYDDLMLRMRRQIEMGVYSPNK